MLVLRERDIDLASMDSFKPRLKVTQWRTDNLQDVEDMGIFNPTIDDSTVIETVTLHQETIDSSCLELPSIWSGYQRL